MSIRDQLVILSRAWSMKEGVTIPAGTQIWVTKEQEQELREAGFLEDWVSEGPGATGGPGEDDEEFLDVHHDDPGGY